MPNLTGKLLIASPHLSDRNFFRTVVLIIRHDAAGAFGIVLNRRTNFNLSEALEKISGERPVRDDPLYWGGPVTGPLTAVHRISKWGEFLCFNGVWGTTSQDQISELLTAPEAEIRFFAGYSGWGEGQLDGEIAEGGWLVAEAVATDLFATTEELWESAIRRVGRSVLRDLLPNDDGFDSSVN